MRRQPKRERDQMIADALRSAEQRAETARVLRKEADEALLALFNATEISDPSPADVIRAAFAAWNAAEKAATKAEKVAVSRATVLLIRCL